MRIAIAAAALLLGGGGRIQWTDGAQHDRAIADAKTLGRCVMIYFTTSQWAACDKLDAGAFSDKDVVKMSERFVRILAHKAKQSDVHDKYAVKKCPTLLFLDPDGEKVAELDRTDPLSVERQMKKVADERTRTPKWEEDLDVALDKGKTEAKPVVLFWTDGKATSDKMQWVFSHELIAEFYEKLEWVRVKFEKKEDPLAKRFKVTDAPQTFVLDPRAGDVAAAPLKRLSAVKTAKDLKAELEPLLKDWEAKK